MTCTHTCIISWLCASFNAVNMVEINCDTCILNILEKKNKTSNSLIKYLKNESIEIIHQYTCKTFIVSSFRLDKIVSSIYNLPRSKAVNYIRSGFVKVNHKEVEEISYLCNNSDIISLRRYGRVKIVDTKRVTKQNNYVIEGYFYK